MGSHDIEASWAGGVRGREVMDRIFPVVSTLLSDKGIFYLVIVKENDVGKTIILINMSQKFYHINRYKHPCLS